MIIRFPLYFPYTVVTSSFNFRKPNLNTLWLNYFDIPQCKGYLRCYTGACPATYPGSKFKSTSKCCGVSPQSPAIPAVPASAPQKTNVYTFTWNTWNQWGYCPDQGGMIAGFNVGEWLKLFIEGKCFFSKSIQT